MSRDHVSDEVDILFEIAEEIHDLVEQQVIANALAIHALKRLSPAQLALIQRIISFQLDRIDGEV